MDIVFLLKIGLLIFSVISLIGYAARRADNRASRDDLLARMPVARPLTRDEREALEPFLQAPGVKHRTLVSTDLLRLDGKFVRHGVTVNANGSNSSTMHNTIGGVDVMLPYDAESFLQEFNTAEVAMTAGYGIVVRLNEGFDLLGGRDRALAASRAEQAWKDGVAPAAPAAPPAVAAVAAGAATAVAAAVGEPAPSAAAPLLQMLGQRDESELERQSRRADGGWLAALALLPGLLAVGLGSLADDPAWRLGLLAVGAALTGFGLWRALRPAAHLPVQRVNRIEGPLLNVSLSAPTSASGVPQSALCVGGSQRVELPAHWRPYLRLGAPERLDVRVSDHAVLRYGPALSVDEEERLFPTVRWGRPVLLAVAGALALVPLLAVPDDLRGDAAHAYAWARSRLGGGGQGAASGAIDTAHAGDLVRVKGPVHCGLSDQPGRGLDCDTLHPGVPAAAVANGTPQADANADANADAEAEQLTLRLYDGSFARTRVNYGMQALASMMLGAGMPAGAGYSPYLAPSLLTLSNFEAVVDDVDRFCAPAEGQVPAGCEEMRTAIAGVLQRGDDEDEEGAKQAPLRWAELQAMRREGKLAGGGLDLQASVLSRWTTAARTMAQHRLEHTIDREVAALRAVQHPSATYVMPAGWSRGEGGATEAGSAPDADAEPTNKPIEAQDAVERLQGLRQWAQGRLVKEVDVSGLVTADQQGPSGPVWHVDPSRTLDNGGPALQRVLAATLAGLLLGVALVSSVLRVSQAVRRAKAVDAHWQGRLGVRG